MGENFCKWCNQQRSKLFLEKQCDIVLWSEKTYTQDLAIPVLKVYPREVPDHEYQGTCKNCIVHNNKKWNQLKYPRTILWIDYCGIFTGKYTEVKMNKSNLWTWVWESSRSWWWTGKPGMLQSMGCKESDTTEWLNWTELNWTELKNRHWGILGPCVLSHFSHVRLCATLWIVACFSWWNSPGQNTSMCSHSLLQRIFPTQGSKPHLLHWHVGSSPLEPPGKSCSQNRVLQNQAI